MEDMESGDGVDIEHVDGSLKKVEKDHVGSALPCLDHQNESSENDTNGTEESGAPEGLEIVHGMKTSGVEGESPSIASISSEIGPGKKIGSNALGQLKKPGILKGDVGKKTPGEVGQKQQSNLSKSLTFPSKGNLTSGLKRSVADLKTIKADMASLRLNGSEMKVFANGKISSNQKLSFATKTHQLPGVKVDKTPGGTMKTMEVHHNLKPSKYVGPNKTDEDARSITSITSGVSMTRNSTGFGFAFRLDERAEKRKQFFMKLEEKIQAIEVEKTNQEEKSKEDQEAEIKQLRKSLTFKATPMPTFYKEPAPLKFELKKIPTTRPISPKLGRRKASVLATGRSDGHAHEGAPILGTSIKSSLVNTSVAVSSASKNPILRSVTKLPTQKTSLKTTS